MDSICHLLATDYNKPLLDRDRYHLNQCGVQKRMIITASFFPLRLETIQPLKWQFKHQ